MLSKDEQILENLLEDKDLYLLVELLDDNKAKFYDHRNDEHFIVDLEEYNLVIDKETIEDGVLYELPKRNWK
ncbi:hypothetical protein K4S71_09700 [Staphylococcus epidermidis]|nr:hypothetical protein [Staphylococcus epidermidis]MCG1591636.1 hypothetical protein [Staphylococcus epidermidis]MCG2478627.1 hypothetical protein [Staphylococcus epidermidis]